MIDSRFIEASSLQLLAAAHVGQRDQEEQDRYRNKEKIKHRITRLIEVVAKLQQKKVIAATGILVAD